MNVRSLMFGYGTASRYADIGLLLGRVIAGLSLTLAHGIGKLPPAERFINRVGELGFPVPIFWGWAASLTEFAGGILLALGLFTRPTALVVAIHFAVVAFLAHAGDPFGDREKAVLFGAMALVLLFAGAGRYSVDALISRRKR